MIYLNEKEFKPVLIFFSVIFIPPIITLWVMTYIRFEYILIFISLCLLLIYVLLILLVRKTTKTKKNYLIIHEESFEIHYPNIGNGTNELNVKFCDVIEVEYYRITSIRGWFQILGCVAPKCTYITYLKNGKRTTELMGFFDLSDIKKITSENGIRLILK